MPADLFLCAGEASGDLQASLLVSALRARRGPMRIAAVGGDRLRTAGADLVVDSVAGEWASIGHLRAYFKIPWLPSVMLRLAERLLADPPRLLVCVDFGAFNVRMLEWLRFRGYRGRALYYFPPAAWLDRAAQARKVAGVATPLTPFSHQAEFYRSLGLRVEFFGHPLASVIEPRGPREPSSPPAIAIMPGSRDEEVERFMPILADAAMALRRERASRFVVVAASDARERQIRSLWPACGEDAIVRGDAAAAVAGADVAWVASGTAVLETALRAVPQIAFYRLGDAQYRIAQRRIPHIVRGPITLPNLVTGDSIVPELLQYDFTADRLVRETARLLDDRAVRDGMLRGYTLLREALGPRDALERIAAFVDSLLAPAAGPS